MEGFGGAFRFSFFLGGGPKMSEETVAQLAGAADHLAGFPQERERPHHEDLRVPAGRYPLTAAESLEREGRPMAGALASLRVGIDARYKGGRS